MMLAQALLKATAGRFRARKEERAKTMDREHRKRERDVVVVCVDSWSAMETPGTYLPTATAACSERLRGW